MPKMNQLIRAQSQKPAKPCPCGGKCLCHRPSSEESFWWFLLILGLPVAGLVGLAFIPKDPPEKRTIHVGSKVCEVKFVKTSLSCTSTGFCRDQGYEEAVCPP